MKEDTKNKLRYIFDVLDRNKIEELQVDFYGSGDDGNMEISGHHPNNIKMDYDEVTIYGEVSLYNLIMDVCDTLLYNQDVDYANGNGNEGSVDFDVKKKSVTLYYDVVTEAEHEITL